MNQDKNKKLAQVFHYDLYGKREEKYNFLLENDLQSVKWTELKPDSPNYFFVPKDFSLKEEYEKGFKIDELFNLHSTGLQTKRDLLFIDTDKQSLKQRLSCLLGGNLSNEFVSKYNIKNSSSYNILQKIEKVFFDENKMRHICYRPLDVNYIYYDKNLIGRSYINIMQHFLKGKNIGLLTCRQQSTFDFQHVFVTENITDMCAVSSQTKEATYIFPLYLYKTFTSNQKADDTKTIETVNLNKAIADKISETTGLQFMQLNTEILDFDVYAGEVYVKTEDTEKLFDYIYAVLHSRTYREKYKEFLKIDFPRIPYPENVEQFENLAKYGYQLRKLHLMENVIVPNEMANFTEQGSNEIENSFTEKSGDFRDNKVYINDKQFFDNVPEIAWNFYIGGYKPAQKWLKDRKGRTLNYEEIQHYRKIIAVLAETERIMGKIE